MAEPKTKTTEASVERFLASLPDEKRRADAVAVCALMTRVTKEKPKMWGSSIIGFGSRNDWMLVGFSPRKAATVLYLSMSGDATCARLLPKLGKHKTGKGCLYVNRLGDVDLAVLKELVEHSVREARKK